jgi:hypothetical protein
VADYIGPTEVISPKAHWHLFDVILDRKEGNCAYALGTWDGERRIGFRWNGNNETGPIGNPQSRGLPTWTMLDPALHEAVVGLLRPEKQSLAKRFLQLRSPTEWRSIPSDIRRFHQDQVAKIAAGNLPIPVLEGALLVMHVVPFSAVDAKEPRSSGELFKRPERFPPFGTDHPRDSKINHDGLLTGSNNEGLIKPQRAYVHVSRSGIVESVVSSLGSGKDGTFLELPSIQASIIGYARFYTASLNSVGIVPPVAILVSLVHVTGKRLLQDFISNALAVDLQFGALNEDCLHLSEAIFETVPTENNESAKLLSPLLDHMANAAGLASSPYFDAEGNYTLKFRIGLLAPVATAASRG